MKRSDIKSKIQSTKLEIKRLQGELVELEAKLSLSLPSCGQIYIKDDGCEYIVASVSYNTFSLISLDDGNRWTEPATDIGDVFAGCEEEFKLKLIK